MSFRRSELFLALLFILPTVTAAQTSSPKPPSAREVATRFAPDFHQALGPKPRFDYITKFDFDGDWRGDNNWVNAEDMKFALRAYVYFSVSETKTHYFIHYAAFHPRDYKGGDNRGALLSQLLKQGQELGAKYDPTGKLNEAALAHENDLEGCLVVVAKAATLDKSQVVYVETVSHNRYLKYVTAFTVPASATVPIVRLIDAHAELYVEPKGHGIEALNSNKPRAEHSFLVYRVGNQAGDPDTARDGEIGYELLSLTDELWPRAQAGANETYGEVRDYREIKVQTLLSGDQTEWHEIKTPAVGSAFLGKVGMPNAARPPWGWFDGDIGIKSAGEWFFDPAGTIRKHFNLGESFSVMYTSNEFLNSAATKPSATDAR